MTIKVAVVGATGAVGREMIAELESSSLKDIDLQLLASPRSQGTSLSFREREYVVKAFAVDLIDPETFVLMSAGGAFSRDNAEAIVARGATVIDNSSAWRMDDKVPLIVPEVNADRLDKRRKGIIANPNCSTIQMVVALKPLKDAFGLKSVQVCTYQSVSGSGQQGIDELGKQVEAKMKFQDPVAQKYSQPIAFNVLPAIDVFQEGGHCYEEIKMIVETRKILGMPQLTVFATTARVPTFHCHCEAVTAELAETVSREQALHAMQDGQGLTVYGDDDHSKFPTPLTVAHDRGVHVCRVRLPYGEARSAFVQFWNVADNLRKGAATNAVQILQTLVTPGAAP